MSQRAHAIIIQVYRTTPRSTLAGRVDERHPSISHSLSLRGINARVQLKALIAHAVTSQPLHVLSNRSTAMH
jgi:hypothetical protein